MQSTKWDGLKHARTHAHAHTHAHTRTHTRTHTHARTHTRTHTRTRTHAHAHAYAHTRANAGVVDPRFLPTAGHQTQSNTVSWSTHDEHVVNEGQATNEQNSNKPMRVRQSEHTHTRDHTHTHTHTHSLSRPLSQPLSLSLSTSLSLSLDLPLSLDLSTSTSLSKICKLGRTWKRVKDNPSRRLDLGLRNINGVVVVADCFDGSVHINHSCVRISNANLPTCTMKEHKPEQRQRATTQQ